MDDNLEALARLKNEGTDMITFTSGSTVDVTTEVNTIPGLVAAIQKH
jgi:uroporphyrinogen-III synthase